MKAPLAADNDPVTTAAPPPLPPAAPVLSADHLRQLEAARAASRRISRAVSVARFDGATVACFAALTVLFSLTSVPGLLVGLGMGALAWVELRWAARLRRLDVGAPRVLGINQLALAAVLVAYAGWRIFRELTGAGEYAEIIAADPQLGSMLQPVEGLTRLLALAVSGAIFAIAVIGQGGLALYYFSRARHVRSYVEQTPEWILALQKAGSLIP